MAYDQKQFLDLLQEYKSDETKKARRNVSAIAFVIISAAILKIRLAEVRFLGVDVSKSAELPVLLITLMLLAALKGLSRLIDDGVVAEAGPLADVFYQGTACP